MKMVKSLLLGTAAGLVAMTGAQAADLPVKAKPVQYVKICSLYGAGFYYIPGTDMCLKVGGWVRQYMTWNTNGSLTTGPMVLNVNTRGSQTFAERTRGYITADARNQTEFGTLRSYIAVGLSSAPPDVAVGTPGFSANRAFIQLAGFTFGLSQSFYDFHATPAYSYFGGNINASSDSGDAGKLVTAYTAQFGNGLSASISAEAQRNTAVVNANFVTATNAAQLDSHLAMQWPDVVANLRVDQAWGSAQIMGAIHDVSGQYYLLPVGNQDSGHPSDKIGWAIGAGAKFLLPMIAPGDLFSFQVNYTEGAGGFANNTAGSYSVYHGGLGGSYGYGAFTDGVYGGNILAGTSTDVELTTTWGVNAAFEHFWSKRWQTSLYGAYVATSYNDRANAMLCVAQNVTLPGGGAGLGSAAVALNGCDNNFAIWIVGSRTQWNIDPSTYIGVDVAYLGLNSASRNAPQSVTGTGAQPTAIRNIEDQNAWLAQFRVHRNFYP